MPEPQIKFGIGAQDKSRAAFDSFTRNVRRSQAEIVAMQRGSRRGWDDFLAGAGRARAEIAGVAAQFRNFAAILGVSLGVSAIRQAIADIGSLGEKADEAGTSIRNLQALTSAAISSGLDQEQIVQTLAKLNDKLAEAETKGNRLGEIFKANGVAIRDQNGAYIDAVTQLQRVADLVQNAASHQDQMAIATEAFGDRIGRKLLPLLVQGGEEIERLMMAAEKAGDVVDDELVKKADQFDDAWAKAAHHFEVAMKSGIVEVATDMQQLLRLITQALSVLPGFSAIGSAIRLAQDFNIEAEKFRQLEKDEFQTGSGIGAQGSADIFIRTRRPTVNPVDTDKPTGTGGRKRSSSSSRGSGFDFDADVLQTLDEHIKLLEAQARAFGLSEGAAEALEERERALNEIRRQGREPTETEIRQIDERTTKIGELVDAYAAAQKQLEMFEEVGQTVTSSLDRAFAEFTESGKLDVKEMVRSMLADLAQLAFHNAVSGPLGNLLSKGLGGMFGGGIAGGGTGGGMPTSIVPSGFGAATAGLSMGSPAQRIRVAVHNAPAGTEAKAQTRSGANGDEIDIWLEGKVGGMLPGQLNKAVPRQFGASPLLTGRS